MNVVVVNRVSFTNKRFYRYNQPNNFVQQYEQLKRSRCQQEEAGAKLEISDVNSSDTPITQQTSEMKVQGGVRCVGTGLETSCSIDEDAKPSEKQTDSNIVLQALSTMVLVSPFFFWGTSMVAMKQVVPHTMPLFTASIRLIPSGILLILWGYWQGRKSPSGWMPWAALILFGLVDGTGFQGFLAEGLQRTTAGLGSVVIDSQPITVALLAALFLGEKINVKGAIGLLLGVGGLLLIELPAAQLQNLDFGINNVSSLQNNGEFLMLLAAQSMAVGTVMVPWVTRYCDPVMATGWHMILGGLPLVFLSVHNEGSELVQRLQLITPSDLFALIYTSLLGGAAGYGVYFYNASQGNITKLSSLTFLTPIFAVTAGFIVLGEGLTPIQIIGATITLVGVYLINNQQQSGEEY